MSARRYILVYKGMDTRLNPTVYTDIFDDFKQFETRVEQFLSHDNGADSIILAAQTCAEWEFVPETVVKEYRWKEKKS